MVCLGSEAVRGPSRPHSRRLLGRLVRSERGTAVVEFALVAPMLFLLVLGILDFGRALNYYNDLTQLAGQGARAAAVDRNPDGTGVAAPSGTVDNTCNGLTWSIQCQLAHYYPTSQELKNGIDVCIQNPVPSGFGSTVTVRATYHFQFLPLIRAAALRLSATQTERFEGLSPSYTAGDQTGSTSADACSP
jgi:Flp pilus assembly protein TadG